MKRKKSIELYRRALSMIPGGVNSPVRAFKAIGISPTFIKAAKGSKIWDVDGNEYVDYVGSWGPMILGHAHPTVVSAIEAQLKRGTSFYWLAQPTIELAELVVRDVPCEVCLRCGERYYAGPTLLQIERRFKAIYEDHAQPQDEIQVPVEVFA